jgi:hypothetical protein
MFLAQDEIMATSHITRDKNRVRKTAAERGQQKMMLYGQLECDNARNHDLTPYL